MKSTRRKAARNGAPLRQVAALPFRVTETGGVEVLVLTTRETRRFTLPKGWIDRRRKAWKSAAQEAQEEAGVAGRVKHKPIGTYTYWKRLADHFALVEVDVYPLKVEKFLKRWPERRERFRRWLPARDAALLIDEPQLHHLVEAFGKGTANALIAGGVQRPRLPNAVDRSFETEDAEPQS
ncbi:NUDIX hydrolase [Chelatococcus asaccharovorans]|uniref:NUDIX hydrolase n=1 Tax=Chelatococcus asaccharovorans TaxID=28210 RepID=UPI00224C6AE7|nr:NUDIX hydrolase [Chelatococcus asaccharovorans]CAH1670335.1 NUDIX hydrolase [Chelatococcus asaccharovorans]CAH1678205.1 NUDIX hydrolase [Chelatococcus asaccharovorans]